MKYKYITSILAVLIIISGGLMSIISKDYEKSDLEGRKLQALPLKSNLINDKYNDKDYIKDINNGQAFKTWDNYFSDHIVGRKTMVNTFTKIQSLLDKKLINGVYIGKDDYIFSEETIKETTEKEIIESANYFNELDLNKNAEKVYLFNLPHKIMVYEDKVPINGYKTKGNKYMDLFLDNIDKEKITPLDFRQIVGDDQNLYYKADHHWNLNGAFKGYEYIINTLKKDFKDIGNPIKKENLNIKSYKDIFLGTDGRKISANINKLEDMEVYDLESLKECELYFNGNKRKFIHEGSISKNRLNNDYLVYLNGDFPKLVSENKNSNNKLKLVLIGDSMDNILLPLLAPHFKTIYNYDLRKYKKNIVKEISDIKPDIILMTGLSNNFLLADKGEVFNIKR